MFGDPSESKGNCVHAKDEINGAVPHQGTAFVKMVSVGGAHILCPESKRLLSTAEVARAAGPGFIAHNAPPRCGRKSARASPCFAAHTSCHRPQVTYVAVSFEVSLSPRAEGVSLHQCFPRCQSHPCLSHSHSQSIPWPLDLGCQRRSPSN